jgi:hypothetical protein
MIGYRRLFGFVTVTVAVVVLVGASATASAGDASGGDDKTCTGGSVAPGVYSNLKITGVCTVDAGSVKVKHDVTVLSGGALVALYGGTDKLHVGSNLNVLGDIHVLKNGILFLGCEPVNQICLNDPDQKVGSYFTRDAVGGKLIAEDALAVVVHLVIVGQDVTMTGGGGGDSCSGSLPPPLSGPPYGDLEDIIVGGNLAIKGWTSCWLGFFRNGIAHDVDFSDNVTNDPDGNEIATNSILGNLKCAKNNPSPQTGDSGGSLNNVFGHAHGQCANPKIVR